MFMDNPQDQARALKYRRLALAEPDPAKAALLRTIADEAERGILYTPDRVGSGSADPQPGAPRVIS